MISKNGVFAVLIILGFVYFTWSENVADNSASTEGNSPANLEIDDQNNSAAMQSQKVAVDLEPRLKSSKAIPDYETARPIFWSRVYRNGGRSVYCAQEFSNRNRNGLNIEHVFPMSWVTNALDCGTRNQCRRSNQQFNRIEADLHNLYPARTDVNRDRASFRFGEVAGENRDYGTSCDFEVDSRTRVAEPAMQVRGDVARAMFYMAYRYKDQGLALFSKQQRLLADWHQLDPPTSREIARNQRIESIQGNRNPFIDRPEELTSLIENGYFR